MDEKKIKLINKLESELDDLFTEWEGFDEISPEDLNEYYGFINDCQLAKKLREIKADLAS